MVSNNNNKKSRQVSVLVFFTPPDKTLTLALETYHFFVEFKFARKIYIAGFFRKIQLNMKTAILIVFLLVITFDCDVLHVATMAQNQA